MPEIPTFVATQSYGSGVAAGGTIPLSAANSGMADGFERAAAQFAHVAEQANRQAAAVESAKITGDVEMQAAELSQKYANDPDPSTAPQRFRAELMGLHKGATANITNSLVRNHVEERLARSGPVAYIHMLTQSAHNQKLITAASISETGSNNAKALAVAPDAASAQLAIDGITRAWGSAAGTGAVTPEHARMGISNDLKTAIVMMAADNPARAQAMTNQVRGQLDSQHVAQIETSLKAANNGQAGMSRALEIFQGRVGGGAAEGAPTAAPTPTDASAPRGVRNNNPLNLTYLPGQGASGSDGRFGRYDTMEGGIKAAHNQLLINQDRGLTTLAQQINRWAPPNENDTNGYVAQVAKATGIDPNAPIDMRDTAVAGKVIAAMAQVENGRPLDQAAVDRALTGAAPAAQEADWGSAAWDSGQTPSSQPSPSAAGPPPAVQRSRGDMMRQAMASYPDDPAKRTATVNAVQHLIQADEADRVDQQRAQHQALLAIKAASDEAETRVIADAEGVGKNPNITAGQIADPNGPYNALTADARLKMISFVDRKTKPDPLSVRSAAMSTKLITDIRREEGDPDKIITNDRIYNAYTSGMLNRADFDFVMKQFNDIRTPEGHRLGEEVKRLSETAKKMLDDSNPVKGLVNPLAANQHLLYEKMVQATVDNYRKAGKDPFDLFNPQSPQWLGHPDLVRKYFIPLDQALVQFQSLMKPSTTRPLTPAELAAPQPMPGAPAADRPSLDQLFAPRR